MKPLINYLEKNYPLSDPITDITKVTTGYLSENHILYTKSQKYFLKQYRFDDDSKIETIHTIKFYFAHGGIPIILPIENNLGKTYFCFRGRYFALFPFVDGININENKLSTNSIISLAQILAKIHILGKSQKNRPLNNPELKSWNKNEIILQLSQLISLIERKKVKNQFDQLALKTLKLKLSIVEKNTISLNQLSLKRDHLTHGDFQNQNVFYDKKGLVSHVFDLEKSEVLPRIYEVLRSMDYIFLNGKHSNSQISKALLYLESYHQKYPLTKQEVIDGLKVYYLKIAHSNWIETEHYINNNNRVDIFLKTRIPTLRYFSKNLDQFTKLVLNQLKLI